MIIALASDHAGFALKHHLVTYLRKHGHEVLDLGVESESISADYPDAAKKIGDALTGKKAERGILLCGSGVGVSIAANKIPGIYAAICHDTYSARQGVEHDNMNVLCLGGRVIGSDLAQELVDAFIGATFAKDVDRYMRRFDKTRALEGTE